MEECYEEKALRVWGLTQYWNHINKCKKCKKIRDMYKTPNYTGSRIRVNKSVEGETIEQKIERIVNNKEPIKDGAPLIYTERKEGIKASTNIRTDRFEIAVDAMDKTAKSYKARREERAKGNNKDGETEPIQGKVETTEKTKNEAKN